jgi:hypothetical protein
MSLGDDSASGGSSPELRIIGEGRLAFPDLSLVESKSVLTKSAKKREKRQRRAEVLASRSAAAPAAAPVAAPAAAPSSRGAKMQAAGAAAADTKESKGSSSSHKRNYESVADSSRTSPLRKKLGKPDSESRPVAARSISPDNQDTD